MKKILSLKNSELTKTELKNFKLAGIIAVVVIAALLLIMPGKESVKSDRRESVASLDIEQRLEKILSGVKGAGKVKVMVVFKDNGRDNIAMNTEYTKNGDGSVKTNSTAVLGKNKEVVIVQKSIPEVQGVIVTARGAENPKVRDELKKAVVAVLPVPIHRIEILTGE